MLKKPIFAVAPMLDWTTPQCRALHRILCPEALLYSEMISTGAIIHGDRERHLRRIADDPCVLQLGGSRPDELQKACELAQPYDFQEINLNVGCPSDRVQNNKIGAVLMYEPELVAECLNAMEAGSKVPISIKHRLGVDEQDERQVFDFIEKIISKSTCRKFIIHARKAWLKGLSPKENREVPPLNYGLVYEVKKRFPELEITINGGISTIYECQEHLKIVDGVMLGRAVYQQPQLLLQVPILYGYNERYINEILPQITDFLRQQVDVKRESLHNYTRHLLGLFSGYVGAKRFRQILSEEGTQNQAMVKIWEKALECLNV